MKSHYLAELSALADRPDVEIGSAARQAPGPGHRIKRALWAAGRFLGATLGVAVILFVPVALYNFSRVDALEVAGERVPVSVFVDELGALFWGTAIIALAFTSFMTGLCFMAAGTTIRPRAQPLSREDALTHLTVLRLSRSER